jgi:hypothetical protein
VKIKIHDTEVFIYKKCIPLHYTLNKSIRGTNEIKLYTTYLKIFTQKFI